MDGHTIVLDFIHSLQDLILFFSIIIAFFRCLIPAVSLSRWHLNIAMQKNNFVTISIIITGRGDSQLFFYAFPQIYS